MLLLPTPGAGNDAFKISMLRLPPQFFTNELTRSHQPRGDTRPPRANLFRYRLARDAPGGIDDLSDTKALSITEVVYPVALFHRC